MAAVSTATLSFDGARWSADVDGAKLTIRRDGEVVARGEWDGDSFVGDGNVPPELPAMLMATLDGWRPTHRIVVKAPSAREVIVCLDDDLAYTADEWIGGTWPQWTCSDGQWTHTPQVDDESAPAIGDFSVERID